MENRQAKILIDWYYQNGRDLPWRVKGGAHPDPYVILVSEFMLQQTTVKTVIPYFYKFMQRFPTIQTLAQAPLEDVYLYWQGLGYYTRARSLHTTAQQIVYEKNGIFPQDKKEILKLKGIGPYTAASISALAFNLPETVIDGNVKRIICRLYHLEEPLETISELIRQKAEKLTSQTAPADYASAIMDLGATICTPKKPQCLLCPWQNFCLSKGLPDIEKIPAKNKINKRENNGSVYLIFNPQGEIFIRQNTDKKLLSGLYEFPWTDCGRLDLKNPIDTNLEVCHIFTHIKLKLHIYLIRQATNTLPFADGFFTPMTNLKDYPFSTLMKKVFSQYQKSIL